MSAAVVRAVYTALAARTVSYTREAGDSVTVTGLDLSETKNRVGQAQLPVRILAPIGPDAEARGGHFAAIGSLGVMELYIADDFLLCPAQSGLRLEDVYPDLVRYVGAYFQAMRGFRQPVAAQDGCRTTLEGWEMTPAVINWSEVEYLGVHCKVTVKVMGV